MQADALFPMREFLADKAKEGDADNENVGVVGGEVAGVSDFGGDFDGDFGAPSGDFGAPSGGDVGGGMGDLGSDFSAASSGVVGGDVGGGMGDFGADVAAPPSEEEGPLEIHEKLQRKRREEVDEEQARKKEIEVQEAKKDVAEFMEERKKRRERNRESNSNSKEKLQNTDFDPANPWANLSFLIDLDMSSPATSRMSEILKTLV